ncbi:MAG TPA: glutamate formimidoyltransferase [Longimicrobiales bacterium]|nr:glutamate formimidoyltransferase [Longimicrobiales bacterium]
MSAAPLLEAVPNFSEGRDPTVVLAIVDAMRAAGADVLDWSADADHHRCVVTLVGAPAVVEDAAVAGARVAVERIDLNRHKGVHPRVGALDVLPLVPVAGATMADARASARRVGQRLSQELGIPVYFYGAASEPPGRPLSALRKGGFETLLAGWPTDRPADVVPEGWPHTGAHPTAGVTCVGARPVLLAWNVFVTGIDLEAARRIARTLRETSGGFLGVRALALRLPNAGRLQISMNLENVDVTPPMDVFRRIETLLHEQGGAVEETEIIGMLPDQLLWGAAADRLKLVPETAERLLSRGLLDVLTREGRISQDA